MVRRTALQLARDAALAAAVPSLAWAYLSWRHKLGIGAIYVWPWVLMTTLLYAYRADKLGLNSSRLGKVAYDLRAIRVASLPFLAAIVLPLLNFAISPQAPEKHQPLPLVLRIQLQEKTGSPETEGQARPEPSRHQTSASHGS